jgi:Tol biopolymer transport system component
MVDSAPEVSPNGRQIAFAAGNYGVVTICQLPNCDHPSQLKVEGWSFHWAPSGQAIAFVKADDPTNIWEQPLDGGAPRQLTKLAERDIFEFSWSSDGSRLLLSRGNYVSNMVLLKGLH